MIRALLSTVLALGLAGPGAAVDLSNLSPQEKAAFGEAVRAYLMDNPHVILEAVAALEAQEAAAQAQADLSLVRDNAEQIFNDGFSFVGGNPDGDITLVEFFDYRCGFCKRAHPEVAKLLESDGNIRLIKKEFPILGEQSVLAARFAIAVKQLYGDARYADVSNALIAFSGDISMPSLARMADLFDLDAAEIEGQMMSAEVSAEIQATRALAQALQINGTPTFVMQDELIRGFVPYDQMLEIVGEKRG